MGFCTEEQARGFLKVVPLFEQLMIDSGIILLKYWLEVSPEEQTRRLQARIGDGRKTWKLSPMDLKSYDRWDDYTKARDEMFATTDTLLGALVRRALRGQEARAPQRDQPPAEARSVQGRSGARRSSCQSARSDATRPSDFPFKYVPETLLIEVPATRSEVTNSQDDDRSARIPMLGDASQRSCRARSASCAPKIERRLRRRFGNSTGSRSTHASSVTGRNLRRRGSTASCASGRDDVALVVAIGFRSRRGP